MSYVVYHLFWSKHRVQGPWSKWIGGGYSTGMVEHASCFLCIYLTQLETLHYTVYTCCVVHSNWVCCLELWKRRLIVFDLMILFGCCYGFCCQRKYMHDCQTHPNMHSNQTSLHTFKAVICNPINLSQFLTRSIVSDLCGFLKPSHCFIRLMPSNLVFEFVPSV